MSSSLPPQQQQSPRAHLPLRQRSSLTEQARKGGKLRQLQPNNSIGASSHEQHRINFLKSSSVPVDNQEEVSMLQKRVKFLRTQHTDTLTQLHGELERLKAENRDLNFKLVMCQCGISREDRSRQLVQRRKATPKAKDKLNDDKQLAKLEHELNDLRVSLEKANKRNSRLMKVVEKMMQRSVISDSDGSTTQQRHKMPLKRGVTLPTKAVLLPEEYEDIIGRLELINGKQADEIKLLKKDFQDLLLSDDQPLAQTAAKQMQPASRQDSHKEIRTNVSTQESDEDLLYISPSQSRVMFPYIPIKPTGGGGHHDTTANMPVRLPPLTNKPGSLVSNGTRHKKLMGSLQHQRNKLSTTFPR